MCDEFFLQLVVMFSPILTCRSVSVRGGVYLLPLSVRPSVCLPIIHLSSISVSAHACKTMVYVWTSEHHCMGLVLLPSCAPWRSNTAHQICFGVGYQAQFLRAMVIQGICQTPSYPHPVVKHTPLDRNVLCKKKSEGHWMRWYQPIWIQSWHQGDAIQDSAKRNPRSRPDLWMLYLLQRRASKEREGQFRMSSRPAMTEALNKLQNRTGSGYLHEQMKNPSNDKCKAKY